MLTPEIGNSSSGSSSSRSSPLKAEGASTGPISAAPTSMMMTMMNSNNIPAMMYSWQMVVGGESKFHCISDYCQELLGVTAKDVIRDANCILDLILEEDMPMFHAATVRSRTQMSVFDCRVRMKTRTQRGRVAADQDIVTVHFKSRPRRGGGGESPEDNDEDVVIWDGVAMQVESSSSSSSSPPRSSAVAATTTTSSSPPPQRPSTFANTSPDGMVDESIRLPLPQHYQQPQIQHYNAKHAAVKQLVHAERSLTEWLSHEVRNPLSVTMEALQTVQELQSGNDGHLVIEEEYSAAECYQVMTESITYVVDLLNNMMDLDQCAQGQMPVVTAPCTVKDDILLPTYRMMKRLRPKDGPVQLRLASGANTFGEQQNVVAIVDKLRLRQVLTNLIANAFHFTTTGFVEIDLQIQEEATKFLEDHHGWASYSASFCSHATTTGSFPPQRMLAFHVRDSGCGVKPSEYDTLFSRWDQLGTSRNGTGIGLCLCQALVKAMGGSIRLNTEYTSGIIGHPGAEFIVEVPIESTVTSSHGGDHEGWAAVKQQNVVSTGTRQKNRGLPDTSLSSALFVTSGSQRSSLIDQSQPLLKAPPLFPMSMSTPTASAMHSSYSRSPSASPERRDSTNSGSLQPPLAIPLDSISSRSSSSSFASALATSMNVSKHRRSSQQATSAASLSPSPQKNRYFRGKYNFLIVDDEKMGRKFLKRRFSRLFPEATVTEVPSGEEALVKAASQQYDVITMDHFMAVNEMNGDETIRELRSRLKSDALIVGISGNDKQAEHLQAGADSFFQKPLPSDPILVESLRQQLAPPAGWRVLILSDDEDAASILTEKLCHVSSPHYTTEEEAKKRWKIMTLSLDSPQDTIDVLTNDSFDLVVLVDSQTKEDGASSGSVRKHLLQMAKSGDVVFVDCLRSEKRKSLDINALKEDNTSEAIGLTWSLNSLPSIQNMRQSLCEGLLSVRGVGEKTRLETCVSPVRSTQLPPRRTNSGVAKSA